MSYENLKLKNQLCFPLYACSREIIKMYKPHLDNIRLTYTQYIAMMVLWEEESCTVKELGQRLFLDSGTLTPLLKRLEQEGLVTRERSSEDERSLIVTITEKGTSLKDEATCIPTKMAEDLNLSSEETQILYTLLYKILDNNK